MKRPSQDHHFFSYLYASSVIFVVSALSLIFYAPVRMDVYEAGEDRDLTPIQLNGREVLVPSQMALDLEAERLDREAQEAAFSRVNADPAKAVLEALTKAFTPMPDEWGAFNVQSAMLSVTAATWSRPLVDVTGAIVVWLDYAEPPSGEDQAEQDTKKVVGVILDWLRSLGEGPRKGFMPGSPDRLQGIKVRVIAWETDGEIYGESSYGFQKDLVKWVEYDPERDGPAEKWTEKRSK